MINVLWALGAIAVTLAIAGILSVLRSRGAARRAPARAVPPLVCDDDGTGTCRCEVGDDAVAMVKSWAEPTRRVRPAEETWCGDGLDEALRRITGGRS
ncbi:MAG TPA: hypothetical protein VHZ03_41300 [Trebonia sp.]|nr:hypothetical protein [Trebonia sp.]